MEDGNLEPNRSSAPATSSYAPQQKASSMKEGSRLPMVLTIIFISLGLLASFYVYGLSLALEKETKQLEESSKRNSASANTMSAFEIELQSTKSDTEEEKIEISPEFKTVE